MARKILLADDSVTAQNMGRKILADAGYEVITVNNGSAALKKIAEQKPDLIVLDVYMPGYSGLEVCQRLKEAQETARIPVLLTVGKLEPFKPEEARRVRAEGFIVKPFEASELLSALSKLEDKIVPRSESSKPGRFARAIASMEDSGRSGRSGAGEADSGWKNRISFPSKKKGKPEKEDGDDTAIYNAVNRDLRTVVDHGPAPSEHDAVATPQDRVDVGALGAPGVRDVSAEEIAAIAAAAAQVQASSVAAHESREPQSSDRSETAADRHSAASFEEETLRQPVIENIADLQAGAPAETVAAESSAVAAFAEPSAATVAETTSDKFETRHEESTAESRREETAPAPATDVIAAIAASESSNGDSRSASYPPFGPDDATQEIPVTMAMGSTAGVRVDTRWMAIPVAIDPDEAAISLELEMQKAYAAFAAAEANSPGFVTSLPEAVPPSLGAIAPTTGVAAEPEFPACGPAPELANSTTAVTSASAESVGEAAPEVAAVTEPQTDAPSYDAPSYELPINEASINDAPREVLPPESEPSVAVSFPETTTDSTIAESAEVARPGKDVAAAIPPVQAEEPGQSQEMAIEPVANKVAEEPVAQPIREAVPMMTEAAAVHGESAAGGTEDMAEKTESELAASTAAAWASWRQIRETGPLPGTAEGRPSISEFGVDDPSSPESAAMAVAAGAEKAPEEASAADDSDPAAIASIVDSVLADLRPKIVEEISRKLGKRK